MSEVDADPEPRPEPSPTGVAVSAHHSPMAWTLVFTKLTVEIDGEPVVGRWRRRFVPTSPGQHRVEVYFRYVGVPRGGEGSVMVEVPEGGVVRLAYRAPNLVTSPGRLEIRR
jgi:hypothetical protein